MTSDDHLPPSRSCLVGRDRYARFMEPAPVDAAAVMTAAELETTIAALHARERAFLVAGDVEAASSLMQTKFVLLSNLERRGAVEDIG